MRFKGHLLISIFLLILLPVTLFGAEPEEPGSAEKQKSSQIDAARNVIEGWEEQIGIEPTHAYFGEEEFFVRFLAGDYAFYSSGTVPEPEEGKSGYDPGSYVLKLDTIEMERWEDLPEDAEKVSILPREEWLRTITAFHESITPPDGKTGTVVDFLDEEGYEIFG